MGYSKFCDNLCIRLKNCKPIVQSLLLPSNDKGLLGFNKKWKESHLGERCFIVGNGPSLMKQNLSSLSNEYVFTVNQIMKSDVYETLRSDFHVIADPLYFEMDANNPDCKKIIGALKQINYSDKKPECFFPLQAKNRISSLGLDDLQINYFLPGYQTSDRMKRTIDLTKSIYCFNTVAQYAILIAMYMGFSEIYLLGCDMTGYKEVEQFAEGRYTEQTHIYKESAEDMKKALHSQRTCEEWFCGFAKMFVDYRRLFEYTKRNGVQLFNLTEGGVLDSVPREKFEDIIGRK